MKRFINFFISVRNMSCGAAPHRRNRFTWIRYQFNLWRTESKDGARYK